MEPDLPGQTRRREFVVNLVVKVESLLAALLCSVMDGGQFGLEFRRAKLGIFLFDVLDRIPMGNLACTRDGIVDALTKWH